MTDCFSSCFVVDVVYLKLDFLDIFIVFNLFRFFFPSLMCFLFKEIFLILTQTLIHITNWMLY